MSSKHFCVKWTRFQTNILSAFESLQNSEDLADVTLTCDGISVKAHKFILSACSPYFRTIFKENPCSHPIVILKDVAYVDLIAIVNFMYHGEVMVSEEQLSSFLHTAMVLQVSGLMNTNDTTPKKQCPSKKAKVCSKPKKIQPVPLGSDEPQKETDSSSSSQFEVVEVDRIKTENVVEPGSNNEFCADINENVKSLWKIRLKPKAALEVREKPSSILERSLTSQAISGKSPSSIPFHGDKICVLPDLPKTIFIPRKPPEADIEKRTMRSSSESSSPSTFDRPSEILQQCIKVEGEHYESLEVMSPEDFKEVNFSTRNVDLQPHHSSQCGNCPHCGKIYSNQSALKYHVRLVHSDLTNMYCCHLCPESFDYREGYKKHMAEVHLIRN
ncbi:hypothetical protein NQ318_014300 [Aromia moschata]|uniref:Uncharacterized protein n=1 Tax=Aromia moschata TaxID=1265417 RepID=A0AAV8Z077_9CUCU|nr:hypothetical protein NQ318_014300 [Aromia moschata]